MFAMCMSRTPTLGGLRAFAAALDANASAAALPASARAMPTPNGSLSSFSSALVVAASTTRAAARAPATAPPPFAPAPPRRAPHAAWDWRDHVVGTAPRWLDLVRPAPGEWKDLALKNYELEPMLRPQVNTSELPSCVWQRLATLCAVLFHSRVAQQRVAEGYRWVAQWERGLRCVQRTPPHAAVFLEVEVGKVKPTSTEVENAILLEPECDAEGSGTRLAEPMPPAGVSSLPLAALHSASGDGRESGGVGGEGGDTSAVSGDRMAALHSKLRRGERVRVLAIGASNTAMFAPACVEDGCVAHAHEPLDAVAARWQKRASQHGALGASQPDWLMRLLLTLHTRYPASPLLGVAHAYGGLDPKTVASCLADFLESSRPWASLEQNCTHGCSDAFPDVLILDFAIYAGKQPDLNYLTSLEKLLRHVHGAHTVVLLLNMANCARTPRTPRTRHARARAHHARSPRSRIFCNMSLICAHVCSRRTHMHKRTHASL
jgi:hypothetical protein